MAKLSLLFTTGSAAITHSLCPVLNKPLTKLRTTYDLITNVAVDVVKIQS